MNDNHDSGSPVNQNPHTPVGNANPAITPSEYQDLVTKIRAYAYAPEQASEIMDAVAQRWIGAESDADAEQGHFGG